MYVKFSFERIFENEQRNELFVCMPFHDSLDKKFAIIRDAAKKVGFDDAIRVKENKISDVITTKIFEGIANSKMLLFDLSDDPKFPCEISKQVNGNVLYELGIANSFRDPQDIILIRNKKSNKLPFDISAMTYIEYDDEKNELLDNLISSMKEVLINQDWSESKLIKSVIQSLNELSVSLMYRFGRNPDNFRHFSSVDMNIEYKDTVARLINLGILRFACTCDGEYKEYAYHWTALGYEVMKALNIKRLSMTEYKAMPYYQVDEDAQKRYHDTKESFYNTKN